MKHSELELKWDAAHVHPQDFVAGIYAYVAVERYDVFLGTDRYYRRGDDVLRYRHDFEGRSQELTVKQRKSEASSRDRVEVNVALAPSAAVCDVEALARTLGFEEDLVVTKRSHVLRIPFAHHTAVLAFYDVWRGMIGVDGLRTFIEAEIESHNGDDVGAEALLDTLAAVLMRQFNLKAPINDSLYEMYTGKRYTLAKEKN